MLKAWGLRLFKLPLELVLELRAGADVVLEVLLFSLEGVVLGSS